MRCWKLVRRGCSRLRKIPVSSSHKGTCPPDCPGRPDKDFHRTCCAAANWTMNWWERMETGPQQLRDGPWGEPYEFFLRRIKRLKSGQIWRHNLRGDLVGEDNLIDVRALEKLVTASKHTRGFTYTHYPVYHGDMTSCINAHTIKWANENGFTINLSANSPEHADYLAQLDIAPITTLLPSSWNKEETPGGIKILLCPAGQTNEEVTCDACQTCLDQNRDFIVGWLPTEQEPLINEVVERHTNIDWQKEITWLR